MSVDARSPELAYATKKNILFPPEQSATAATAAKTRAASRATDDLTLGHSAASNVDTVTYDIRR